MSGDLVVVWGNCQAEPVGALLAEPLRAHHLRVVDVPAVFLVDVEGLRRVHELVAAAAVLVTQPVRDEYSIPGCGAAQLTGMLPHGGRAVTFPVTFHAAAFPFQVNAHGGDGARVDAPLTDYHDLRALVAAERGLSVDEALAWWPVPAAPAVQEVAATSLAELQRRERELDVTVSDLVDQAGAMFTISHPTNLVLAEVARRVLGVLGLDGEVTAPAREFLGARRAPVEAAVVDALGWDAAGVAADWRVDNAEVPRADVVAAHLALYRERPDIPADSRVRYAQRLDTLGL